VLFADERSRRLRQPRSRACARMRSMGDFATTATLIRCVTCGTVRSRLSRIDVHEGHALAIFGPYMKLYTTRLAPSRVKSAEKRTRRAVGVSSRLVPPSSNG